MCMKDKDVFSSFLKQPFHFILPRIRMVLGEGLGLCKVSDNYIKVF